MTIYRLDHLVLTVEDIDRTCQFYTTVLGMEEIVFGQGRRALRFGPHKINLHQKGQEICPHAAHPTPGSADLCLLSDRPLEEVIPQLRNHGVEILLGPVPRTGAMGAIASVYIRDPDGNLIEISHSLPINT